MKKLLLHSIILLSLTVGMTSCVRQSLPEFADGRYHHHINSNPHSMDGFASTPKIRDIKPLRPISDATSSFQMRQTPIGGNHRYSSIPNHHPTIRKNEVSVKSVQAPISTPETGAGSERQISQPTFNPNDKANVPGIREPSGNRLLCAVIAIFIPPLGVILYEQAITINFWIDLILTILFYLPGLIFALIVILS